MAEIHVKAFLERTNPKRGNNENNITNQKWNERINSRGIPPTRLTDDLKRITTDLAQEVPSLFYESFYA